jgi:hypothetical protein
VPLADGAYQVSVHSIAVTDANGLPLGVSDSVFQFDVESGPA